MDPLARCAIREFFAALPDPRVERTRRRALLDLVTVALCAAIRGAGSWVEVERFGRAKEAWPRSVLPLPHGIPSHGTFGRVFAALDPAAFAAAFLGWVRAIAARTDGAVVAVDGKTARRSHDRATGKEALHPVSAWATANGLVLGQVATSGESDGIAAIPALLGAPGRRTTATGRSGRATAGWRSGAAGRPATRRWWRGSTRSGTGRGCAPAPRWPGSAGSAAPPRPRSAPTSPACRPTPRRSARPCAAAGGSRTASAGCSTSLRRETTAKVGGKAKRLMAGWDAAYLLSILAA